MLGGITIVETQFRREKIDEADVSSQRESEPIGQDASGHRKWAGMLSEWAVFTLGRRLSTCTATRRWLSVEKTKHSMMIFRSEGIDSMTKHNRWAQHQSRKDCILTDGQKGRREGVIIEELDVA